MNLLLTGKYLWNLYEYEKVQGDIKDIKYTNVVGISECRCAYIPKELMNDEYVVNTGSGCVTRLEYKTYVLFDEDFDVLLVNNYPVYTEEPIFIKYCVFSDVMNIDDEFTIFKEDVERYLEFQKVDLLTEINTINKLLKVR